MDKAKLVEKLNQAIGLELSGLLQYNQYANVLMGQDRKVWQGFFRDSSDEALTHARKFAERVTALGGVPAVEPEAVRQTSGIHEMLQNSLDHERKAVEIYTQALALCEDHAGYRNLLEDQIQKETEDVEELEKYLNQVTKLAGASGRRASKSA
jgi:bacterioferritin (cytochrome b1)